MVIANNCKFGDTTIYETIIKINMGDTKTAKSNASCFLIRLSNVIYKIMKLNETETKYKNIQIWSKT